MGFFTINFVTPSVSIFVVFEINSIYSYKIVYLTSFVCSLVLVACCMMSVQFEDFIIYESVCIINFITSRLVH